MTVRAMHTHMLHKIWLFFEQDLVQHIRWHGFSIAGKCGITLNCGYSKANNSAVATDREAAYRAMNFDLGWFAHPIYSNTGDWPEVMKARVRFRSNQQNVPNRLPQFSADEIQMMKGKSILKFLTSHK